MIAFDDPYTYLWQPLLLAFFESVKSRVTIRRIVVVRRRIVRHLVNVDDVVEDKGSRRRARKVKNGKEMGGSKK